MIVYFRFKIVVILLLIILLSGCKSNGDKKPLALTIWGRNPLIEVAVNKYNQYLINSGTNLVLKFTNVLYTQLPDKFASALASGTAPDIVSLDLVLAPYFNSIGAFMDLSDFYESLPYRKMLSDAMVRLGMWKGRIHMLPFFSDNSALFWNKRLFADSGQDPDSPPETWVELVKYARRLTRDIDRDGVIDVYGLTYSGGDASAHMFLFLPFVWANGGSLLNEDGTKAAINSPEAVEALSLFTDLALKYKVFQPGFASYSWIDMEGAFISGKTGMFLNGNWNVARIKEIAPDLDFGVALIPGPEKGKHSSFAGGDLIGITSRSKYKKEALDFLRFALSKEVQVEVWAKNGIIPVRRDFFNNRYFEKEPKYLIFAKALEVARTPYSVKYNELYEPFLISIQKALMGKLSPEEALKEAEKGINRILSSP
ncbi:MAG: ABC transporter substrate-binding protein [Fidelibacterota bacterium]